MAFPLGWFLVGLLIGVATTIYWERLKEWAIPVISYLADKMNKLVEVLLGGAVFFIREGRKFFKTAYLYTLENQKPYRRQSDRVEIKESDIPSDLRNMIPQKTSIEDQGLQTLTLTQGTN